MVALWVGVLCVETGQVQAAEPKRVLVYGDSLSAAYNLAPEQGWVHLLDAHVQKSHPAWRVGNASVSGETTDGGLRRLPKVLDELKPALLVLELGANDGLRGLPLDQAQANLSRMVDLAKERGIAVLLLGMEMPPNYGPEYTNQFRGMFRAVAEQHKVPLLPFLLEPIAADRSNFLDDNLHPTAAAQAQVRDHVWASLKPLLE
ncbi:MAG: arylesterase [Ahniella sp.]|nr:arylesterase [Ahniella sp.]